MISYLSAAPKESPCHLLNYSTKYFVINNKDTIFASSPFIFEKYFYFIFRIDALESSHPISIPVKHPDEIQEIFDRISYGKGAAIIRMMDKFLTTETFRKVSRF